MTPLVQINDTSIPDPSFYESTTATIVDSARNTQGVVVGAVIRNNVAKISLKWRFISAQNWADILSLFHTSFYNSVTFFNQDANAWETRTMYVSDRQAGIFLRNADGTIRGYTDASLDLVEV